MKIILFHVAKSSHHSTVFLPSLKILFYTQDLLHNELTYRVHAFHSVHLVYTLFFEGKHSLKDTLPSSIHFQLYLVNEVTLSLPNWIPLHNGRIHVIEQLTQYLHLKNGQYLENKLQLDKNLY